jgi:hypothetical protein
MHSNTKCAGVTFRSGTGAACEPWSALTRISLTCSRAHKPSGSTASHKVLPDGFGSHGWARTALAHGDLTRGRAAVCAFRGVEPAGKPFFCRM